MTYAAAPVDTQRQPGFDPERDFRDVPSGTIEGRLPAGVSPNGASHGNHGKVAVDIYWNCLLRRLEELPELQASRVTIDNAKWITLIPGEGYRLNDLPVLGPFVQTHAAFRPGRRSAFEAKGADILEDAILGGPCLKLATDTELQGSALIKAEQAGIEGDALTRLNKVLLTLQASRLGVKFEGIKIPPIR